ncbi:hypothetical protein [Paenibacillus sp. YPG26]|nr:hypothetical protein [Paenibacillus sp. YPG26]USB31795.1 hypothetical protein LDO05_10575 [Paenibacillus sp. YPG26]
MTGRNNKPKNTGPAASPSRLDQFGQELAEDMVTKVVKGNASRQEEK